MFWYHKKDNPSLWYYFWSIGHDQKHQICILVLFYESDFQLKDFVKYYLEHQWKDVKLRLRPLLKKTHLRFQENHFETSVDQTYYRSTGDMLATLIWGRSLTRRWIEGPGKMSGCFFGSRMTYMHILVSAYLYCLFLSITVGVEESCLN